jgi:tryptophan-rich hypothetical protein
MNPPKRLISPKKLLHSKWTAVSAVNKEKHFMIVKLIVPDAQNEPIALIALEAVHSKHIQTLPWQQLNDDKSWLQGWV